MRGAYFLAWTLLRSNDVRMIVYTRDIPDDDPHRLQMVEWGVEFRSMPSEVSGDVFFEMTWNKPAAIADAMIDNERVLWLDSDTSVAKSVAGAFEIIDQHVFGSDHGIFPADSQNHPDVWRLLGEPKRKWDIGRYPTAGVIGFKSGRDDELISEWRRRVRVIVEHPEMWDQDRSESPACKLKYHDQGVLQDLLVDDAADGTIWSNFQVRREGTVAELMRQTYGYDRHVVCHYGGPLKPWFGWDDVLRWDCPF